MSEKKKMNPLKGIVNYFKEVRAELKKVVWPTFSQVKNNTIIVIVSLVFVGAIIWVLDLGFGATLGTVIDMAEPPAQNDMLDSGEEGIDPNQLTQEQMDELMQQMQEEQGDLDLEEGETDDTQTSGTINNSETDDAEPDGDAPESNNEQ